MIIYIHTKAGVQVRLDCADIIRQQGRKESVGNAKMTRAYTLLQVYCAYVEDLNIRRLPVSKMNQGLVS